MYKIFDALKAWLTKDFPWKVAAFFMAFLVWFFILNITDPIRTTTIRVPLQLRNEQALRDGANEIHLENIHSLRGQTIAVQVRGNETAVEELQRILIAYIDLQTTDIVNMALEVGDLNVPIRFDPPEFGNTVEHISTHPANAQLTLDTIIVEHVNIEVEIRGEVDETIFFMPRDRVRVSPQSLPIRGPSALVNDVERLLVSVDASGYFETFRVPNLTPQIILSDGSQAPRSVQPTGGSVEVEVLIHRRAMLSIAEPQYIGNPMPGFGVARMRVMPIELEVHGPEEVILNMQPIMLSPIPLNIVETANESFVHTYLIHSYLPDEIYLINPSLRNIEVEVVIEPIVTREFIIPLEDFIIHGRPDNAEILTEEIILTISGLASDMDALGQIRPTARLQNLDLAEGYHDIPLTFSGIGSGFSILGEPPTLALLMGAPYYDEINETIGEEESDYLD